MTLASQLTATNTQNTFMMFSLGRYHFCAPVEPVQSIILMPQIRRMPMAPKGVLGTFMFREKAALACDLGQLLDIEHELKVDAQQLVVVSLAEGLIAFNVDHVSDIVSAAEIEAHVSKDGAGGQAWLEGYVNLEEEKKIAFLTRFEKLFEFVTAIAGGEQHASIKGLLDGRDVGGREVEAPQDTPAQSVAEQAVDVAGAASESLAANLDVPIAGADDGMGGPISEAPVAEISATNGLETPPPEQPSSGSADDVSTQAQTSSDVSATTIVVPVSAGGSVSALDEAGETEYREPQSAPVLSQRDAVYRRPVGEGPLPVGGVVVGRKESDSGEDTKPYDRAVREREQQRKNAMPKYMAIAAIIAVIAIGAGVALQTGRSGKTAKSVDVSHASASAPQSPGTDLSTTTTTSARAAASESATKKAPVLLDVVGKDYELRVERPAANVKAAVATESRVVADKKPGSGAATARTFNKEISHTVQQGETLWVIAQRYLGNPYRYPELAALSQIRDPNWIFPGDVVRIRKD